MKSRVAVALPRRRAQGIDRQHQPRPLPGGVVRNRVRQAILVRRVGEAGGAQRRQHAVLHRHDERLGRVGHAAGDRHLPDQRPIVEARGQLLLQPGPCLPIGRTPETADGAGLLIEDRLDRRAAQRLRPIRRLETAPHPELDRDRLLRISLIVGADLGERPVDDIVGADLRLRRGLQLLPAGDHHEPAEDAGLGVERFQRIDGVAAVADEAIGAHGDQPADRRLDVLGRRLPDWEQEQAGSGERQSAEGKQARACTEVHSRRH